MLTRQEIRVILRARLFVVAIVVIAGCQASGTKSFESETSVDAVSHQSGAGSMSTEFQRVAFWQEDDGSSDEVWPEDLNSVAIETGSDSLEELPNIESKGFEQQSISLPEIECMALATNPTIRKVESEIQALRGKRVQVGLYPNPRAGVFGDDINDGGNPGRYGIFYSQKVVRSNRLGLARKEVCAEIDAKEVELEVLRSRLLTDVRLRYYELLVVYAKEEVANNLLGIANNAVQATEQLVEAREAATTTLTQAELELEKAKLNVKRVGNEVTFARRRLAVFMGSDDLQFGRITGELVPIENLPDIEIRFQEMLAESPELARMFAEVDIAKRSLNRQCAARIADVTWQAGLAYDFGSDDVVPNFQIGVPLLKYNRNQGAIAQARHQVSATHLAAEQKALEIRQRLIESYRVYKDAKLQVDAMKDGILPKALETLQLLSVGYEQGEVGFLQLLTAQRTYNEINLEYVQQLQVLWRARILIEGMLLSDSLRHESRGD